MANNRARYGFRWYASYVGAQRPANFEGIVASGYQANVGGGSTNVGVSIGDPIVMLADGTFELAQDTNTSDRLLGVVTGIVNAKVDANSKARPASYLPGGTTYATEATTTKILWTPFADNVWEVDVDENTTATTLAAYRLLKGLNADFVYTPDTTDANRPRANPQLDISTAATTAGLHFRILDVSKTQDNQDFSGTNVKLLVQLNQGAEPALGTTGIAGL